MEEFLRREQLLGLHLSWGIPVRWGRRVRHKLPRIRILSVDTDRNTMTVVGAMTALIESDLSEVLRGGYRTAVILGP
jgi:hypothetical protein